MAVQLGQIAPDFTPVSTTALAKAARPTPRDGENRGRAAP
jgi:hypothetical protein